MDTLKPLVPEWKKCRICSNYFTSFLKLDATPYITCPDCRLKIRIQGQKHRDHIKLIRSRT